MINRHSLTKFLLLSLVTLLIVVPGQAVRAQAAQTPDNSSGGFFSVDNLSSAAMSTVIGPVGAYGVHLLWGAAKTKAGEVATSLTASVVSEGMNLFLMAITGWLLALLGLLMWLGGMLLDLSVYVSVTSLHLYLGSKGVIYAWSIVRDLCNMSFIFLLLYVAVRIIIGQSGNAQRLIANIIIAALLINFSGFFVRVGIDLSNVVANEFYQQISPGQGVMASASYQSVGWTLFQKLNVLQYRDDRSLEGVFQNIANNTGTGKTASAVAGGLVLPFGYIFNIFIYAAMAGILFWLAFSFLIRTITLIFIFIFSPLALLSYFAPQIGGFKKWSGHFVEQLVFAPFALFVIFLVMRLVDQEAIKNIINDANNAGVAQAFLAFLIYIIIVMGVLIGGMKAAKDAGGKLAGTAQKWGAGTAGLVVAGGAALTKLAAGRIGKTEAGGAIRNLYQTSPNPLMRAARFVGRTEELKSPVSSTAKLAGKALGFQPIETGPTEAIKKFFKTGTENREKQVLERFHGPEEEGRKMDEKFKRFKSLTASEQALVYSKLKAEDRAKLENEAKKNSADSKHLEVIEKLRNELKGKDAKDLKDAAIKEKTAEKKKEDVKKAKELLETVGRADAIAGAADDIAKEKIVKGRIRSLKGADFTEFFEDNREKIMADEEILESFSTPQLTQLFDLTTPEEQHEIRKAIEIRATHPRKPEDKVANASKLWLENPNNLKSYAQ